MCPLFPLIHSFPVPQIKNFKFVHLQYKSLREVPDRSWRSKMDEKDDEKKSWVEKVFENSFNGFGGAFGGKGGGYSIQVTQTPEGTVVNAKLSDNMDRKKMKHQLQQKYPNAKIKIKGGKKEASRFKIKERKQLKKTRKREKEERKRKKQDKNKKQTSTKEKKKVELEWVDE